VKLFEYKHENDFGQEHHFILLRRQRWCLLQVSFSFNDEAGSPYVQVSLGGGRGLNLLCWVGRFGMDLELVSQVWEA